MDDMSVADTILETIVVWYGFGFLMSFYWAFKMRNDTLWDRIQFSIFMGIAGPVGGILSMRYVIGYLL